MQLPTDRTVFQNAWVVDDIDAAIKQWSSELKVGPFFVAEYTADILKDITYRGQPSELSMIVAMAQAGPVQIELIQPTTDKPCAYRDTVKSGATGFHHMCVWTHDMDADIEYFDKLGYPMANLGRANTSRFGYFDTTPLMGCMLEVVEYSEATESLFKRIAEMGTHWDGSSRPRREMAELF
ncbi:MAG: VOC family protein [Pseudomonadota bacterium]